MSLITDHIERAKLRLLEQYKRKPNLAAFIESILGPIQDIENVLGDLETDRWLDTAVGAQLDQLGTIIGIARVTGQSDDDYRVALKSKIVENTSQGEPERVIAIYQILVGAALVFLDDGAFANVGLMSEVDLSDQDMINLIYRRVEQVIAAGVRLDYIGSFDETEPFAFAGSLVGKGFGSLTDAGAGGKMAIIYINKNKKFSFAGTAINDGGFGSLEDPLVGGVMVGS